jgi:hypothetical protein
MLTYGQYNITVSAKNAFTNPDIDLGVVNISLMYLPESESTELTTSMAYFAIIVLLIVSSLSLVYLSYRQQEMRISTKHMKDISDNYYRQS